MSDRTKWEKAKNWVFGGGGAVAFLLFMGFVDWRIDVKVDAAVAVTPAASALTSTALKTDQKIIDMDTATAANTSGVADNKDDITINRENVVLAFEALMGRPAPDAP